MNAKRIKIHFPDKNGRKLRMKLLKKKKLQLI